MTTRDVTIESYNRFAGKFATKFDRIGTRKDDIDRVFGLIAKANPKVVELGCGNGRDAKYILTKTEDYLGMDASSGLTNIAKEKTGHNKFVISDFDKFNFPENVDVIFAFASLLHADKQTFKNILKRASKSLNKKGLFYISLKYKINYSEELQKDEYGVRCFYYYSIEDVKDFAGQQYKTIWSRIGEHGGQQWMDVLLQKSNRI